MRYAVPLHLKKMGTAGLKDPSPTSLIDFGFLRRS